MRRFRTAALAALTLAVAGGATVAQATVTKTTFTGTISAGFDNYGIFGPATPNLLGQSYTMTIIEDDQAPGAFTLNFPGGIAVVSSVPSNVFSGAFTAGGHTFTAGDYGEVVLQAGGPFDSFGIQAHDQVFGATSHLDISMFDGVSGPGGSLFSSVGDLNKPFDFTTGGPITGLGSILVQSFDNATSSVTTLTSLRLEVTEATRTVAPEPSTWALVVLGFAGLGGVLRRRARTVPV